MMKHAKNDLRCRQIKWILTAGIMVLLGVCYSCSLGGGKQDEGLLLSQAREEDQEGFLGVEGDGREKDGREGDFSGQTGGNGASGQERPKEAGKAGESPYGSGEAGESARSGGKAGESAQNSGEAGAGEAAAPCFIHICGAVEAPGVYRMEEGSRVYQAVEAAGGFLPQADEGYLNLAAPVYDGMKITVYTLEEAQTASSWEDSYSYPSFHPSGSGKEKDAKVNINTAGKEELMSLKGIGESRAEDIIAYREKHGAFSAIEEIMQVPGIKEGAFEKIKETITVR